MQAAELVAGPGLLGALAVQVLTESRDLVVVFDREWRPLLMSDPMRDLTADQPAGWRGLSGLLTAGGRRRLRFEALPALHGEGAWQGDLEFLRTGRPLPVSASLAAHTAPDDAVTYSFVGRDVTARRQLEVRLVDLAMRDPLTGLANRRVFGERLAAALARPRAGGDGPGVLLVDLDGFKAVNDGYGHGTGDALLSEVGHRLRGTVRGGDLAARIGGDEFAVLLERTTVEQAETVRQRIQAALAVPHTLTGPPAPIAASVGVAVADGQTLAADLVRAADLAMYRAKHRRRAG